MLGGSLLPKTITVLVFFQLSRLVDHLMKYFLFSYFQFPLSSCRSIADLVTVISDRSRTTQALALDICKAFWQGLACWSSFETQVFRNFRLALFEVFSAIDSFNWFLERSLSPTVFLLYINGFPDNIINNIEIYADDYTHYSKFGQAYLICSNS